MPVLAVENLVVEFPAVRALGGVSIEFRPGEVHGVIGENGAGKSTLMRVLAGLQRPTSGRVRQDGREVEIQGVRQAVRLGIAMIHQELNLVDDLSVAENIYLGREDRVAGVLRRSAMNERAGRHLTRAGATFSPSTPVGQLSLAQKQLVEIAKALAQDAITLLMDEPTAVLSEPEAEALFALIGELKSQGVGVVYISHRLAEVQRLCDRISVLRDGEKVAEFGAGEADPARMASAMVGRPLNDVYPPRTPGPTGSALLEAQGLGDGRVVREASFVLRPGELVGLAGLVGSGRTELAELLVGLRPLRQGTLLLDGAARRFRGPRAAGKAGVAYVSEDRKATGLVLGMNVIENTTLANLRAYANPVIRRKAELSATEGWVGQLGIRAGDLRAPVRFLSGGNQQKVSVAKWLDTRPRVLILDEPTRGVDVGAKRELYDLIHKLAADGLACLIISSEMPELLGLCHRLLVMREGRLVAELPGTATEEEVMHAAAGVEAA